MFNDMLNGILQRERAGTKGQAAGLDTFSQFTQRHQDRLRQGIQPGGYASAEQQTRRQWMGNWVQPGDREGYREPGTLFGRQPPRPPASMPQVEYTYGLGDAMGIAGAASAPRLLSQHSGQQARQSLIDSGTLLHAGRQGAAGSQGLIAGAMQPRPIV